MARRVTRLEDLAAIAGVSIATVSRALNDSSAVNEETKRRVWKIAREHNYAFRRHMPAMASGSAGTIALVIPAPQGSRPPLADPFFLELMGGLGEAARDVGLDMLVSRVEPRDFEDLEALMTASRADGVIFLGQSVLHDAFNHLAETEKRFVVWGADLPGQRYCSIGSDNVRGGMRATAHLARLGRKHIAFFGDTEAPEAMQRLQGYRAALEAAGLAFDPALVAPAHFEIESAQAEVDSLLARGVRFDAIVAASDLIAIGAVRGLLRAGLSVPEAVAVVGYDDLEFARFARPALTTISQDLRKAGRLLVSKLLAQTGAREILSERLPTDLIVRESCGA